MSKNKNRINKERIYDSMLDTINYNVSGLDRKVGVRSLPFADLKQLRDNGGLIPGKFYRITDYETTTTQKETRSACILFDIIVQALDNQTLSENAQAIHSERDVNGYFDGVNLGAWKLKYRLDNDDEQYYWADTVNGKGVIYRMIDEYGNDLPYDFKNIQFKRYWIDEYSKNTEFEGRYYALKDMNGSVIPRGAVIDVDYRWAYTFTVIDENGVVNDVSLNKNKTFTDDEGTYHYTKNNKIGNFTVEDKEALGNNVVLYDYDYYGYWEFYGFNSNTIGNDFSSNTIGNGFNYNTIGNYFNRNTIGNDFCSNTIGNGFYSNTIGNDFSRNSIGNYFYSNTTGYDFSSNTIGNYFNYNTIENNFYNNTIGNNFNNNTIGNNFNRNSIGNYFYYNAIGNDFYYNATGNYVRYIQFSVNGTVSNSIRYLYIRSGLEGASQANKLDLYYSGLYHRLYPTYIERTANGNIVSIHQETPLVWAGKKKITNTSSEWEEI